MRSTRWAVSGRGMILMIGVIGATLGLYPTPGASQTPRNLQILAGVDADQLQLIMEATRLSLGVECAFCHDPSSFASDLQEEKRTARRMMEMVGELSQTTFELLESPSCWTCHRGNTLPQSIVPETEPAPFIPTGVFRGSTGPAGTAYENLSIFADIAAEELEARMVVFARSLGVGCEFCHNTADWASDENIRKPLTRIMVQMQRDLNSRFFDGRDAISCWTCHRGAITPQSSLPPTLVPPTNR
jgi:hypothetical protein